MTDRNSLALPYGFQRPCVPGRGPEAAFGPAGLLQPCLTSVALRYTYEFAGTPPATRHAAQRPVGFVFAMPHPLRTTERPDADDGERPPIRNVCEPLPLLFHRRRVTALAFAAEALRPNAVVRLSGWLGDQLVEWVYHLGPMQAEVVVWAPLPGSTCKASCRKNPSAAVSSPGGHISLIPSLTDPGKVSKCFGIKKMKSCRIFLWYFMPVPSPATMAQMHFWAFGGQGFSCSFSLVE